MPTHLMRYEAMLERLDRRGQHRSLAAQSGLDFTSNDYLGLAASPRLCSEVMAALRRGVPVGAGGSRLLRGNHPEHEMLETEAAAFFGADRMLYFGSGYMANLAVLSTLPQRDDIIIHDALVHASTHDGIAGNRASALAVRHNDVEAFEDAIRHWRQAGGRGHPWIAVESLYSMDGDRAPLDELATLADRHDGFLVIDEAHATGVYGIAGRGLAAELEGRDNVIVVHTCGKALGASGALVGANRLLCDVLINRARPFIYATAPSPLAAASIRAALKVLATEPERQNELGRLIDFANAQFDNRLGIAGSGSQILPVVIGDVGKTLRLAARLQQQGFDIRAIRPPTVPIGTARLRISITLHVDAAAIISLFDCLADALSDDAS